MSESTRGSQRGHVPQVLLDAVVVSESEENDDEFPEDDDHHPEDEAPPPNAWKPINSLGGGKGANFAFTEPRSTAVAGSGSSGTRYRTATENSCYSVYNLLRGQGQSKNLDNRLKLLKECMLADDYDTCQQMLKSKFPANEGTSDWTEQNETDLHTIVHKTGWSLVSAREKRRRRVMDEVRDGKALTKGEASSLYEEVSAREREEKGSDGISKWDQRVIDILKEKTTEESDKRAVAGITSCWKHRGVAVEYSD